MSGEQPVQVRLSGARELAIDGVRHFAALVAVASATMLGTDRDAFLSNFWLSAMVSVPAIVLATALRAFVPPFRTVPNHPYDQERARSVAQSDR